MWWKILAVKAVWRLCGRALFTGIAAKTKFTDVDDKFVSVLDSAIKNVKIGDVTTKDLSVSTDGHGV